MIIFITCPSFQNNNAISLLFIKTDHKNKSLAGSILSETPGNSEHAISGFFCFFLEN